MADGANLSIPADKLKTHRILADAAKLVITNKEKISKEYRQFGSIKSIDTCHVVVVGERIYPLKDCWKVIVLLKIFINFTDRYGERKELVRLITLSTKVSFPLTDVYRPGDYSGRSTHLDVLSAQCTDLSFRNHVYFAEITTELRVVIKITVTEKELYEVLVIQ